VSDERPPSPETQGARTADPLPDAEPEPEWAEAIRRGRRDRAARLRQVFAGFDGEQGDDPLLPARPRSAPAPDLAEEPR
jgi:hypothetical protein